MPRRTRRATMQSCSRTCSTERASRRPAPAPARFAPWADGMRPSGADSASLALLCFLLSFRICRMRAVFQWSLGTRTLELGKRTLIMGIVNVTPDSFSDGGLYLDSGKAVEHALRLLDEGADIIDVGGESTRPGASVIVAPPEDKEKAAKGKPASIAARTPQIAVSAEDELQRVLPVITGIKKMRSQAVVSVDTYKASVARAATAA